MNNKKVMCKTISNFSAIEVKKFNGLQHSMRLCCTQGSHAQKWRKLAILAKAE